MAYIGDVPANDPKESYFLPAGIIMPYAGTASSAPTGWLFCNGASVATASYSDLYLAIGYQYGGSGANFILPDLRGRVVAGVDAMGGTTAANRLGTAGLGVAAGLGSVGGSETHTLGTAQLPNHTHTGTVNAANATHQHTGSVENHRHTIGDDGNHQHDLNSWNDATPTNTGATGYPISLRGQYQASNIMSYSGNHSHGGYTGYTQPTVTINSDNANHSHSLTINSSGGGGSAHPNVQPTVVLNYIIKY
jgi:microcystin-dependent protein